ncbi:MAG: toll/interleukin-1 receptor domain-containing protein, partial [Sphingomicrobium sp.]
MEGSALLSRPRGDPAPDEAARSEAPRRYCAFLSYSHADEKHADWLHRCLEKFRVPKALVGRGTPRGIIPPSLGTVFRDRQELAASSDLGGSIRGALEQSRALIVLCSPTAAQSRWTNEEVRAFKQINPDAPVLAAILAGEPFASEIAGREAEECFPPALRERFDAAGLATGERAEPTAADLREGRDGRRMGLLKLVAGLLGVGLDELVQRETQRRQKRLAILSAASLAGMAVTSTLAVVAVQSRDEARDQRREAEGLVGFMLGDLRDKLEPIGRLDALDAVGSRALAYFAKQDKGALSDAALAQRSRALTLIGEIAHKRGNLDAALKRYQEALASTEEALRRYPDDPQRLFDHAQNVFYVGYIALQRGQSDAALARFAEYRRLADRMVAIDPAKKAYRLEQVYATTTLGSVLMGGRRYREAVSSFQASLAISDALAAAEPHNIDYQKQVSQNLAWLSDAREYGGQFDQALANRERQLAIIARLERTDRSDVIIQRDAMTAHRSVGRLLASRGDSAGGLREALAGIAIADALFRIEPDNTEWLQANVAGRFELAELQLSVGNVAAAAATARAGCDIVERLLTRDRSVADWSAMHRVSCLNVRAKLALAADRPQESFALVKQGLAAARTDPDPINRAMFSFPLLRTGGDALAAQGNRAEALRWWQAAIRIVPKTIELRPAERAMLAALY